MNILQTFHVGVLQDVLEEEVMGGGSLPPRERTDSLEDLRIRDLQRVKDQFRKKLIFSCLYQLFQLVKVRSN